MGLLKAGVENIKRTCYLCAHCVCEKTSDETQRFTCSINRDFAQANTCLHNHFKERTKPIIVIGNAIGVKTEAIPKNLTAD